MEEAVVSNLEKISSSMPEEQEDFLTSSANLVNPGKEDSKDSYEGKEAILKELANDLGEKSAQETGVALDDEDELLVNPLNNQEGVPAPVQLETSANQNDDTQEIGLPEYMEANDDLKSEPLSSQPQPPVDVTSPSGSKKMKFQVVHNNGRMTLRVTRIDQASPSPQGRKSLLASPTTPKTRSKQRRASDTGATQRTKTTEKATGGKTRNKVMSPRSSLVDNNASMTSPNKPLMDLRHILKKYEKKKEPVPQQQACEVGFYGSLSAIPFLTLSNDKALEKSPKEKDRRKADRSSNSISSKDQTKVETHELNTSAEEEVIPEKPRLPTREEIVVTAEYDEEQLKLWKSMTALDSSLGRMERPQEMLPLQPVRKEKKMASPRNSGVRAFSRPEDWLGHPEWNASQKSYRSISSEEQTDDDVLVMEPDD